VQETLEAPGRVASATLALFERPGLAFEETRKRRLFAVLIVPGIAVLLAFAVHHLVRGSVVEGLLDLAAGCWLAASLVAFRFLDRGLVVYRANAAVLGALFVFLAAKGGVDGNKLLWAFSFPLIAFYTLGRAEGIAWTAGLLALLAAVFHAPQALVAHHDYPPEYRIRFYVAFFLVSSLAFLYESARERSQAAVERDAAERVRAEEERRKLEERLARSQKMEALGLLAGGVAHDLNNVLVGVVGYPDALIEELPPDDPLVEPLTTIRDSGQRAAAIVQDLLALARRAVTHPRVVDLNGVLREYLASPEHASILNAHPGVVLAARLHPAPAPVVGSPLHLRKAIMNLVSNAVEALPNGGHVVVKTEVLGQDGAARPPEAPAGECVVLRVEDDGIGISPADLPHVFEPFFTKKKLGRSGTGLGMAVVWGTVQDHGGHVHVESAEGRGTSVTLWLPATREPLAPRRGPVPVREYLGAGETVLVVDDVADQRELARRILTRLGYAVRAVSSGEEAVAAAQASPADLLVLDMIMEPGIDGLETYERIAQANPGQRAILVSGFSETERVHEARALGVTTYVRKPYTVENLGLAVRRALDLPREIA
jgi:signal transduction histidine kinase/CheY-like chemotaxis protein